MKLALTVLLASGILAPMFAQPFVYHPTVKDLMDKAAQEREERKAETVEMIFEEFLARSYLSRYSGTATAPAPRTTAGGNSTPFPFSPVDTTVIPFYGYFSAPLRYGVNEPYFQPAGPPVLPGAFQIVFLDGTGNSLIALDLATVAVTSQVVVPSTSGPLAIRPSLASASNEVWVANGGAGVAVANLAAQNLTTTIATPSVATSARPAGIVFTPDGTTAFEAYQFNSPDSSGNNGALLVFDAVNYKVTSTVPLKNRTTAILIAPDGLTVYLLSDSGQLTYYDVLSGTAGLTVSTFTPGKPGGYPGASAAVFIHPDGTRLIWNVNYLLEEFDLNSRTLTQFTSGLPSTAGPSMTLSQDGQRAYFYDNAGDGVVMDTGNGLILNTFNTGVPTALLPGPPVSH